eukprot:959635-Prymnesium_polylepis.1
MAALDGRVMCGGLGHTRREGAGGSARRRRRPPRESGPVLHGHTMSHSAPLTDTSGPVSLA